MLEVFFWWLMLLGIGTAFMPLTNMMFLRFRDRGWIFSKMIGLFLSAWLTWTLNVLRVAPFRRLPVLMILGGLALLNYGLYFLVTRRGLFTGEDESGLPLGVSPDAHLTVLADHGSRRLILIEELLFLGLMLVWMWIIGFKPEAYGTEKIMDYAFLTSLARSDTLPFADPWYAGEAVNYYYGGQYITAWLMKAVGTSAGVAYNTMRSTITAASFILPFSLVYQLMYDRMSRTTAQRFGKMLAFAGETGQARKAGAAEKEGEDEGVLSSARSVHRALWKRGREAVKEEARVKASRFLADSDDEELAEMERFVAEHIGGEDEDALTGTGKPAAEKTSTGTGKPAAEKTSTGTGKTASEETPAGTKKTAAAETLAGIRKTAAKERSFARDPAFLPSLICGALAGLSTAFGSSFHYVIYGVFGALGAALTGKSGHYWFPDATRYIGYNPDLPDKAISEFPSYSSVLGDLHAHYINILFVLTVVAVVYAWAQKQETGRRTRIPFLGPEILLIGLMTGTFRWTNFWDFPIYFVVCGAVIFFVNLRTYRGNFFRFIAVMLSEAAVMYGCGFAAALPFTLNFRMIASEIGLTHSHTLLHQLLVLWGFPALLLLVFVIQLVLEQRKMRAKTKKSLWFSKRIPLPDLTVLLFGLCAAGLVLMPEVIYVKDIYGEASYRANTMFKLTYQAYILFAMMMAYVLVRAVVINRRTNFEEEFKADSAADVGLASVLDAADLAAKALLSQAEEPPLAANRRDDGSHRMVLSEEDETMLGVRPRSLDLGEEAEQAGSEAEPVEAEAGERDEKEEAEVFRKPEQTVEERTKTSAFSKVHEMHRQRNRIRQVRLGAAGFGIFCLLLMSFYTPTAVDQWFGSTLKASRRVGDDASVFVNKYYPNDVGAVNWLITYVKGQPTILEAPGESYSAYERVSAATGLPTVAGWYVHEWLWRGDVAALDARLADIERIYTSEDAEEVRGLIEKYNIRYIYIGTLERQKYPGLQDRLLQSLGSVVYSDGVTTYILKV